ncbi:hypothetical protein IY145_17785 [Methylosinus sp. H3A]|uniref:hypothetical protein n=1 Tax=Methylosinus sp. H3A TaxID=2785786 RepID=UPI0018C30E1D|nr:hypothetical protein [Methylosinus sp. H3A]MBG0811210.1 hypothetical protein [Methylosinus sp. H3A]
MCDPNFPAGLDEKAFRLRDESVYVTVFVLPKKPNGDVEIIDREARNIRLRSLANIASRAKMIRWPGHGRRNFVTTEVEYSVNNEDVATFKTKLTLKPAVKSSSGGRGDSEAKGAAKAQALGIAFSPSTYPSPWALLKLIFGD